MSYQSINPNTGETLKRFNPLTDAQLEKLLTTAQHCFQRWKKPSYAARAEACLAPVKLHPKEGEAHMESSPLGVLFCVQPWNFPYYRSARVVGPQLMAGNVPQCAIAFERLLLDAGAPVGADINLLISHEQCDRVIDDPRIKGVALTGSVAAGRLVAVRAGQNVKKSVMELGGSDAFIVLDVIADRFLAKFKAALELLQPGDPMDEAAAIALTNDSDFGLGGSIWTADKARGRHMASQIDAGMVFINNIHWLDSALPFGGIKHSGYGRELGNMGIQEFVNKKLVRSGNFSAPA